MPHYAPREVYEPGFWAGLKPGSAEAFAFRKTHGAGENIIGVEQPSDLFYELAHAFCTMLRATIFSAIAIVSSDCSCAEATRVILKSIAKWNVLFVSGRSAGARPHVNIKMTPIIRVVNELFNRVQAHDAAAGADAAADHDDVESARAGLWAAATSLPEPFQVWVTVLGAIGKLLTDLLFIFASDPHELHGYAAVVWLCQPVYLCGTTDGQSGQYFSMLAKPSFAALEQVHCSVTLQHCSCC